jgi:hypothetical protein
VKRQWLDDFINHALNNCNFEVEAVAYRREPTENSNAYTIFILVRNSESFAFLYNRGNWFSTIVGVQFSTRSSSIPPQLSLVLPSVSLQIDWNEFVEEFKKKQYLNIVNVIFLKNKAQQAIQAVKLEFRSAKLCDEILEAGEISIMHMKINLIEYFSQARYSSTSSAVKLGIFERIV